MLCIFVEPSERKKKYIYINHYMNFMSILYLFHKYDKQNYHKKYAFPQFDPVI